MGEILKKRVLAPQNDFLMTYPVICGKFQVISTHHTKLSKFTQEHHREILETSYGCLDKKTMNASKTVELIHTVPIPRLNSVHQLIVNIERDSVWSLTWWHII